MISRRAQRFGRLPLHVGVTQSWRFDLLGEQGSGCGSGEYCHGRGLCGFCVYLSLWAEQVEQDHDGCTDDEIAEEDGERLGGSVAAEVDGLVQQNVGVAGGQVRADVSPEAGELLIIAPRSWQPALSP